MLIWQKGSKGAIRVRMNGSSAYVFVKVEKLQSIVGETFEEVKATRKDCHELSIAYGWLAGAKFITLNQSKGEKKIEFYFKDENVWRHQPEVVLTKWDELFDKFMETVKFYGKKGKSIAKAVLFS